MSARSFTVFLDNPQPDIVKPRAFDIAETIRLPLTSQSTLNNALAPAAKENLDPITGQHPGSATTATSKKRKNSGVLATKVHNPPTSKKQKESTSTSSKSKSDAKKPKSSSALKTKSASSEDKETKRAASGKKLSTSSRSSKSSSRKVSPMPKLDEEGDVLGRQRETIRQAEIDSRCYELTVLPLADVTQAYDASSSMEFPPHDKLVLSRSVKERSAEPELRDYYSPSLSSSTSMPSLTSSTSSFVSKRASSTPPTPQEPSIETRIFSTPERKQIYAAFTFTSPSPTSKRFGLTRSTSVDAIQFHQAT